MYDQFDTDPVLETKGIVIEYETFRVTLARAGGANKKYQTVLEARSKPYLRAIRTETMTRDQLYEKILIDTYADASILLWEVKILESTDEAGNPVWKVDKEGYPAWVPGIEARDALLVRGGKPLPFNRANVVRTLRDLPELFEDLKTQSERFTLYRRAELEEEAGN
jgi:hypothetical protein